MERGFLSKKGSGVRRDVKEKQVSMADKSVEVSKHVNVVLGSNSATRTPNVVNVGLESFPTLSETHGIHSPASANEENMNDAGTTVGPTPTGNTPGMSSYANLTREPSRKALNFRTLFTPAGNEVAYLVVANYVRNTCGKYRLVKSMLNSSARIFSFQFSSMDSLDAMLENALIEVRADVELKDNIVASMLKLVEEGFYTCTVRVEYEWKPPDSDVVKNMKKPSQAPRAVLVGPKKDVEPTIEVSNSNPFDVLNSVKNDVDLGTNDGTSNLASKKANSSRSSFWYVEYSSTGTTPIVEKIERLIIDGKVTFVDDEGKPLTKVDSSNNHDSEDEVASVDNEMANFLG
ncbi:hypothetical protein Tco_0920810 [Tanacetum coccineum]